MEEEQNEQKHEEHHEHNEVSKQKKSFAEWYEKNYKLLLIIPLILILFGIIYQINFYNQYGDIIRKDISLTGGTSVTIYQNFDTSNLISDLSGKLNEVDVKIIYNIITGENKAVIIETKSDSETTKKVLEEYVGYELTDENSSFEFSGSTLSEGFYKQLVIAIIFAFLLMAIVVFVIFRTFAPSTAVIISAFADIFMTLVTVNVLGMKISSAGIVAFLMLIGYSVDTDILLTTRMLKRKDDKLNERIIGAIKTGLTMTLTSLFAVLAALFIIKSFSPVLSQIFIIISIGLTFDIFNTYVTNISLLKWYMEKKGLK